MFYWLWYGVFLNIRELQSVVFYLKKMLLNQPGKTFYCKPIGFFKTIKFNKLNKTKIYPFFIEIDIFFVSCIVSLPVDIILCEWLSQSFE